MSREGGEPPPADRAITILHTLCGRARKLSRVDGRIIGCDDARTFDATEIVVRNLDHLADILGSALQRWDRAVLQALRDAGVAPGAGSDAP